MANTIQLKRSSTSGATPSAGSLSAGELAINTADGKVFLKKDNGTVLDITASSGGYTLPVASVSTLGGVRIGSGVSIDANGFLSATSGSGVSAAKSIAYSMIFGR